MNSTVLRGQTTKGVWIAADYRSKVLIIDCEGTDSKSRSEQERGKFEHSSSLFALAMSDILIINMWTNDVGRYTASNYGVLKIVFEMNLKLFEQKTAKKIIIFLRDFDPNRNRKDKIETLILEDIHKIWSDIKIPEEYAGKGPEKFFSFEFITLPHLIYRKKDFKDEIINLRKRLDKDDPNYFFSNLSSIKNVPADGLKQYVNQIWNDIMNDKDLDIPSQREMLANYRCTEIKNKILLSYDKEFKDLYKSSLEKDILNFKNICIELKEKICLEYVKQGSNYDNKVYQIIYNQLAEQISQKLYLCFLNQIKITIPKLQKFMRKELQKKLEKIDDSNDNYFNISENLRKNYLNQLVQKLNSKKAFDSWKVSEKEYSNLFDEIIEEQKKSALNKLKNYNIDKLKEHCEDLFNTSIENYSKEKNFWKDFNENYLNHFCLKIFPLRIYLRDNYNCQKEEISEIIKYIEDKIYNDTKKNISKNMRDISGKIIDQFRKKFWYEPKSGYQEAKNWNRYEEIEIDILFKKLKDEYMPVFEQLKYFELIKDILTTVNFEEKEEITENEINKFVEDALKEKKDKNEFEILLKQGDILALKKKFETGISNILEEAKRRREGFKMNLPYWFYALLIFFGYDDAFKLIRTWYIIPILMLVGIYLLLVHLKQDWVIKDIYFFIEEKVDKSKKMIKKSIGRKIRDAKLKYNISLSTARLSSRRVPPLFASRNPSCRLLGGISRGSAEWGIPCPRTGALQGAASPYQP